MDEKVIFYASPLYTFGSIDVRDDPSKVKNDLPPIVLESLVLPGTRFDDDPADDLEKWLEKNYVESKKGFDVLSSESLFCNIRTRSISHIEDIKERIWQTLENIYHRVVRIEFHTPNTQLPLNFKEALDERGYKLLPINHALVSKSQFLEYP